MTQTKKALPKEIKPHRILREVFRNFRQYREFVASNGKDVIEHGYWVEDEETGERRKVFITISYSDLLGRLNELSKRKLEAVFYNVIMDMKQKDVSRIMNITTVSVGQYVDTAMEQLAEDYFAEGKNISEEPKEDV